MREVDVKGMVHSGRWCTTIVVLVLLSGCGAAEDDTPGSIGNTDVEDMQEGAGTVLP
jgi:hypothetical protein